MEQGIHQQMTSKSQKSECGTEKKQRASEKLQNTIKENFPSYAKKHLNLDIRISSDIKLQLPTQKKSMQQSSQNICNEDEDSVDLQIGWKQCNALLKAFQKYTNTNFNANEQQFETISNIIARVKSELRFSQRRNFKKSFYYLNIITQRDQVTYVLRNCFGEITRMSAQQHDASRCLPRFIMQNIRQLDNLFIIIHEFRDITGQSISSKNQYFIDKLNKCIYFKKQGDKLALQSIFFRKSAQPQANRSKKSRKKDKITKKSKQKQQIVQEKLKQKQIQCEKIKQQAKANQKQQNVRMQQFEQLPEPNHNQINQFQNFYNFLMKYQMQFLNQRDSTYIKQSIPYFDLHLLNISKNRDLYFDYNKSVLIMKKMIQKKCVFDQQENQLKQCQLKNGHFPVLKSESNKCIQCGARTKYECKLCAYLQNKPIPLCIHDKHQRECLKNYHIRKKLSLRFMFQEQKSIQKPQQSDIVQAFESNEKKVIKSGDLQEKHERHTIQQYNLIKNLSILDQKIDAQIDLLIQKKRYNDANIVISYYRSIIQLKLIKLSMSNQVQGNAYNHQSVTHLKMEEEGSRRQK